MPIIIHYIFLALILMVMHERVFAELENKHQDQSSKINVIHARQLHLNVSNKAVNRINFDHQRVVKIIGNISSFTYILSDAGSDLFIAPKCKAGQTVDFSALLANGDIVDFSLNVLESKIPYLISLEFPTDALKLKKSEAASMMEAMKNNNIGKYYVQKDKPTIIPIKHDVQATIYNYYAFGKLHGNSLTLHNKSRSRSVGINEQELIRMFAGVRAVHIEKKILAPDEKTKAYVVFASEAI